MMHSGIPNNGGYFRPISFTIPSRSVINPDLPAPVAARGLTGFRLTTAIMGALAKVAPDRVPACESGGDTGITIAGWYDDDRPFVFLEFLHASWGGRPDKDGIDACSSISANFSNNPIEYLEGDHPLRIEEYAFVPDTGGAGKYRGGLGDGPAVPVPGARGRPAASDRSPEVPAVGPGGRQAGRAVRPTWSSSTAQPEVPPSKAARILHRGDVLRHTLAGAGGHGDPLERDPALVAEDVADEKVSLEAARTEYGVVLDPVTFAVDAEATAALRARLRR